MTSDRITRIGLTTLLLALLPICGLARDKVSVSARFLEENQGSVEFKFKNESDVDICFPKGDLPWGTLYSTTLSLYVVGLSNRPVDRSWPIDDAPSDLVCVSGGTEKLGKVRLSEVFPTFGEERKEKDLVLFWYYRNKPYHFDDGGYLTIPRALQTQRR